MSPAAAVCDTCRNAIADTDFETGSAVSVLGKNYCGVCKNRAVQDPPRPAGAPKIAKTAAPSRRPARPAPRSSARPVVLAVSIGIAAALLTLAAVLLWGEGPDKGGKARSKDPGRGTPAIAVDPVEKPPQDLGDRTLREKDAAEAARLLARQLEELKPAVAADTKFARYAEFMEKFQRARELAGRAGGGRHRDLEEIEVEYRARYEQEADPVYKETRDAATQLSGEGRYDDALAQIERFPAPLRHSGAWKELERLRTEVQRRKAESKIK